ncbi:PH domain-containing protein [Silanimonas sp.]|uniref:PH domain-containing protein n=1 Tax=Silanimonas sp. TaxID=1929290 RepID=UPI001BBF425B|nr:PH domain-containing protein [Silanimonas sp.]MBS3896003.1 PH domain-containing protein [Silanimonas sp.]MBS3924878.1 PH domain-containing protein [Xanthomonadaceae bacterium]
MTRTPEATSGSEARRALQAAATQRLHPLSWLFILLQQLRTFALPIVLLLVSGRGEQNPAELAGLAGAGVLAVLAVWQYFTYRYGFVGRALVIRSGLLQRNLRLIPFDRVQNVSLHQNLLHRLAGVAEVRLESAGGGAGETEARMQVLRLTQAHALEALVRAKPTRSEGEATPEVAAQRWLHLPTRELVRLGLISNRGMLVVAAAFGLLSQAGERVLGEASNAVIDAGRQGLALAEGWQPGPLAWTLGGIALLLALLALVRLLSVLLAILQFHDFQLWAGQRELRVERGLFSRMRSHLPKRRIQAYALRESLLHRWFGRQSLRIDQTSIAAPGETSLRDLVPLAPPATMATVLGHLLPDAAWPPGRWQGLHPRAWWRVFAPTALGLLALSAVLVVWRGPEAAWLLLLMPLLALRAVLWARYSAWSLEQGVFTFRQGWLDRHWRFVETAKVHVVALRQTPFDRHHGMASVQVDTQGASPLEPALFVPYLPAAEARALAEALRAAMPHDAGINRARTAG